jgi:hypothetical protein
MAPTVQTFLEVLPAAINNLTAGPQDNAMDMISALHDREWRRRGARKVSQGAYPTEAFLMAPDARER